MGLRRIVFYTLLVAAPPLALGLAILILERMSLGPAGSIEHSRAAGAVALLGSLLPLVLLVVGFIALIFVKRRAVGTTLIASSVAFVVAAAASTTMREDMRERAFDDLVRRSEPLVTAIGHYTRDRGAAPENLAQIVPHYLAEIPQTGLGAYPRYEYRRLAETDSAADNGWVLEVVISKSPPSRLVYLPGRNYEVLEGDSERLADWAHVYDPPPGRETQ